MFYFMNQTTKNKWKILREVHVTFLSVSEAIIVIYHAVAGNFLNFCPWLYSMRFCLTFIGIRDIYAILFGTIFKNVFNFQKNVENNKITI